VREGALQTCANGGACAFDWGWGAGAFLLVFLAHLKSCAHLLDISTPPPSHHPTIWRFPTGYATGGPNALGRALNTAAKAAALTDPSAPPKRRCVEVCWGLRGGLFLFGWGLVWGTGYAHGDARSTLNHRIPAHPLPNTPTTIPNPNARTQATVPREKAKAWSNTKTALQRAAGVRTYNPAADWERWVDKKLLEWMAAPPPELRPDPKPGGRPSKSGPLPLSPARALEALQELARVESLPAGCLEPGELSPQDLKVKVRDRIAALQKRMANAGAAGAAGGGG